MASQNEPSKNRKATEVNREQREDRLSSLPDAILIEILSLIPLNSVVTTEVLSTRWRGLWTHIHSLYFRNNKLCTIPQFLSSFREIMRRRTPNFIDTFDFDFGINIRERTMNSWLRTVCDRNLRHLKLQLPKSPRYFYEAPSFIFQTASLVSIDLGSHSGYLFRDDILPNLPNLEKLRLCLAYSNDYEWLDNLIENCSSLKKLSLELGEYFTFVSPISINCSNENLRWLSINLSVTQSNQVTINAPNLEYLRIRGQISNTISLGDVPIGLLNSANIEFLDVQRRSQSNDVNDWISKLYGTISDIRILAINFQTLELFTLFCNVTHLTLILKYRDFPNNFNTVISSLVKFPKLNVLILKLGRWNLSEREWISLKDGYTPALRKVKRIDIDVYLDLNSIIFSEIVEYLLRSATVLEHFNFMICEGRHYRKIYVRRNAQSETREYNFCRLLYNCPRASKECEVLFTGKHLLMSKNTLPNVLKANGEVFPLY